MGSDDAEWDAMLAAAVARAEAAEAAELEEARRHPNIALDKRRAERDQIRSAAAHELKLMGVPAIHIDALRSERVLETSSITKIRQWRRTRSWLILLVGGYGIGKDAAFAWHLWLEALTRAEARRGSYVDAQRCWLNAASIQQLGSYDGAELDRLASVPTLVVPDLGGEHHTGSWLSTFGNLLDVRYGNNLRTLISTNLKGKQKDDPADKVSELRQWIGDRIASRISAGGVITGVAGPNLRELGFDGPHGLSLIGADVRSRNEPEEREQRTVIQPQ
jgi:DNA replication protein DnaC